MLNEIKHIKKPNSPNRVFLHTPTLPYASGRPSSFPTCFKACRFSSLFSKPWTIMLSHIPSYCFDGLSHILSPFLSSLMFFLWFHALAPSHALCLCLPAIQDAFRQVPNCKSIAN